MKTAAAERPVIEHEPKAAGVPAPQAGALPQVAQDPNTTALINAIAKAASDPSVDMDKMERLFKMHEQMVKAQAEAAFNAAMARAQTKMLPIITDAENDHTQSRYATLAAINKAIVPIYSAEGLSVSFDTESKNDQDPIPNGLTRTIALVSHAAGHTRRYHIDLPPDGVGAKGNVNKTAVQAAGSTNEYSRRYLVRMIFNISTYDDEDGNGAGAGPTRKGPEPDADGKAKLEACASADSLKKAWGALTEEQRKTLQDVMAACRKTIRARDEEAARA